MKRIYSFGNGSAEGSSTMKDLLGGKGANLAEMSSLGLSVPPGFTISTAVCMDYLASLGSSPSFGARVEEGELPADLMTEVRESLAAVETILGKGFGSAENPLLVSVRSGARVSMPGMMDTVLNLGLNDTTVAGLAALSVHEIRVRARNKTGWGDWSSPNPVKTTGTPPTAHVTWPFA